MTTKPYSYQLFSRSDYSAFWALFTDNLVNLMVLSAICQFVFQMPPEIVYGRIVPGAAVAILAGVAFYTFMAKRVAEKTGRDVTALPYGISTPVMFVYLIGVIGPIYWSTQDALLAWQVGIGAGFIGGIVAALGAVVGPFLKRITPRAGMLGTLCGIALVFIGSVPLTQIFENTIVGFAALIIILWGLVGRFRLPGNIPAGLVAIGAGTIIAIILGQSSFDLDGGGCYPPLPYFGDLIVGVQYLFANPELFLVLVPVQIYNFIETMNNVESAEAAGDKYPVAVCQVTDGAGTITSLIDAIEVATGRFNYSPDAGETLEFFADVSTDDGGSGTNTLSGGAGDDFMMAGAGDDEMDGGAGDDEMRAGQGDDVMDGGAGDDEMRASGGDDTMSGGAGDDMMRGAAGDDRMLGGNGDDMMVGGAGSDVIRGGAGNDHIVADTEDAALAGGSDTNADEASTENGDTLDLSKATEGVFVDLDVNFAGVSAPGLSQEGAVRTLGLDRAGEATYNN